MSRLIDLFHSEVENGKQSTDLTRVAEFLKNYPDGASRSVFMTSEGAGGRFGPMLLVFSVRKARDILLEGCEYQGVNLQIEIGGRCLPQLPVVAEIEKLLEKEDTLILVDGNRYKPMTEVYGFQQVYDDSVKCIDALKKLGIAQETMAIYATPEEISIEIHAGPLGLEGSDDLNADYYRLLCYLGEIKESNGKPVKTGIKTLLLNSCDSAFSILLPGSNHSTLHRPRVNVGASHFAYGIAAFSDFCGKKRTQQECLQETVNWIKFIQTELPPIVGLAGKIRQLPTLPEPGQARGTGRTALASAGSSGRFQPFKAEIAELGADLAAPSRSLPAISSALGKALGGGWSSGGVHLLVGRRESGKAAMLMRQALGVQNQAAVLFVSYEHTLREFSLRVAANAGNFSLSEMLGQLPVPGAPGEHARKSFSASFEKLHGHLSENFYFVGSELNGGAFDLEAVRQFLGMIKAEGEKLVILESVDYQSLVAGNCAALVELNSLAHECEATVIVSVQHQLSVGKRPHFIEDDDYCLLNDLQKYSDSIVVMHTERTNLRRFVAMVKGQVDAQLVASLEQKALQLAGGKRLKTDSFGIVRLIHTRSGVRELILYLYQADLARFFELAAIPLQRA